eukprot:CAMPEP_0177643794 /NCGR_PEP_ID=MMETSP0447-20121125/8338_1 /TAXON_ID=0 /ORGANISM="Stygamoeba regulata, Strain BSH-02190019" /LENGTH=154 /DNA_ID=CAMNT_0019146099 /DNA_START=51 /DNA_END=511 /DNA_ORIENTATION=-
MADQSILEEEKQKIFGTWTLDTSRSESIAPIMELAGAPWIARWMGGLARCDITIADAGEGRVSVTTATLMRTTTDTFSTAHGVASDASGNYGADATKTGWWEKDKEGRVCLHQRTAKGEDWWSHVVRFVDSRGELIAQVDGGARDGRQAHVRRV